MLEKSDRLLFDKLGHHVAEYGADRVETFIGGTDVGETDVVEKDLLHNKDCHRLAELRSRLHDSKTKRNDLGCKEEVDDVRRIILHQSSDNAKGSQPKVFEGSRFGGRVEEGVEEERDMSWKGQFSSFNLRMISYH